MYKNYTNESFNLGIVTIMKRVALIIAGLGSRLLIFFQAPPDSGKSKGPKTCGSLRLRLVDYWLSKT